MSRLIGADNDNYLNYISVRLVTMHLKSSMNTKFKMSHTKPKFSFESYFRCIIYILGISHFLMLYMFYKKFNLMKFSHHKNHNLLQKFVAIS